MSLKKGSALMLWAISCTDKSNTAAVREQFLKPHREYLQSQKRILVLAGATQNDDGSEAIGSLFIVNVKNRAEAKRFSDGDPFTKAGVFSGVTIVRMRKGQWNPEAAEGA
ncbi:MAG: YciI family protein [Burkholderiales bacterium]